MAMGAHYSTAKTKGMSLDSLLVMQDCAAAMAANPDNRVQYADERHYCAMELGADARHSMPNFPTDETRW